MPYLRIMIAEDRFMMGWCAFMIKGLKKLFSYNKPEDAIQEFELTEEASESAEWQLYRGKHNNLAEAEMDEKKKRSQDNGQYIEEDERQKDESSEEKAVGQNPEDVSSRLIEIIKSSRTDRISQDSSVNDQQNESIGSKEQDNSAAQNNDQQSDEQQENGQQSSNQQDNSQQPSEQPGNGQQSGDQQSQQNAQQDDSSNEKDQTNENQQDKIQLDGQESNKQENKNESDNNETKNNQASKNDKNNNQDANNGEYNNEESKNEESNKQVSDIDNELKEKITGSRDIVVISKIKTPLPLEDFIKEKHKEKKKKVENRKNGRTEDKNRTGSGQEKDSEVKNENQNENQNDDSEGDEVYHRINEEGDSGKGNKDILVNTSVEKNAVYLKYKFHIPQNKDIIIRKFNVAREIPAFVIFVDGMVDHEIIVRFTLPQLMDVHPFRDFEGGCPLDYIEKNVLSVHQVTRMKRFDEIIPQILSGQTVIFIDGCEECLVLESRGFERRGVSPPATETVVNGPQEGFVETLRTNITLIRRIVKSEDLVTEFEFVSKTNNFMCAILYMEGITNPRVVNEVKRRVKSINVDYISGSGMLEQLIEDKPSRILPQVISTERPDRAASFLMEGKVVLICEGAPFAIAMPITFFDLIHTSEEANSRWQYGTFMRIVRFMGVILAAFLPGMYTALILFHQEMIPTSLLASIVLSRAAVPFPTVVEILLMEFSFELIREGGIRVPGVTGNTLGIIGALILGQAAVEAGLVSPILIIIVAVSGLGSFSIPNYSLSLAIRIIRFLLIVFGFIAGFYGISAAFTIFMAFALSMKSFGVPFFSPVAPTTRSNKDKLVRGPLYGQTKRPDYLNTLNERRMGAHPRGWTADAKGGDSVNAEGR